MTRSTPSGAAWTDCPSAVGEVAVGADHRLQFVGRGAVHDHRVGAVAELGPDALRAAASRPGRRRLQPFVGDQRRDVLDLLGGRLVIDAAGDRGHHRIFPEALQHSGIPVVGAHHQIAVALQISSQPADGLLHLQLLGQVIADGGETRPHPHRGRVTAGPLGGLLDRCHAALQGLRSEIGVQNDVVEQPAAQRQRLGAEGHQCQPDVFVEVGVQEQHLVAPDRPVVVEDHLAAPQPAHHLCEVLQLRGGDRRDAEGGVHGGHAATEPEGEPPAGQPVQSGRPRPGDQRVAGVVIGGGGRDLHPAGDRAGRTGQR